MTADVQPAYRFLVTLDPSDAFVPRELITVAMEMAPGAFRSATGLTGELEVTSYAEGGRNDFVHQLPVRHSWGRITLSRGIARDASLWAWYEAVCMMIAPSRRAPSDPVSPASYHAQSDASRAIPRLNVMRPQLWRTGS